MTSTLQDWLATAEFHYTAATRCFEKAALECDRRQTGDPVAFDQWLRLATWHIQAVGASVGLARANSNGASR